MLRHVAKCAWRRAARTAGIAAKTQCSVAAVRGPVPLRTPEHCGFSSRVLSSAIGVHSRNGFQRAISTGRVSTNGTNGGDVDAAEAKLQFAEQKLATARQELATAKQELATVKQEWVNAGQLDSGFYYEQLMTCQRGVDTAQQGVDTAQRMVDNAVEGSGTVLSDLPEELRVACVGKDVFIDEIPWKISEFGADAALDLVTAASEIDEATKMEIVHTSFSLLEPSVAGTTAKHFFRKEGRDKFDSLYDMFFDASSRYVRGGIAGTAGVGKSWLLNYPLRRALREGRTVVAELRKAEYVYLLHPSGPYKEGEPWHCMAWRVDHSDWKPGNCAALRLKTNVLIVDTSSRMPKPIPRVPARTFTSRSKDPEATKEDLKDGGLETEYSTVSLAEVKKIHDVLGILPANLVERRFLVCGGRLRAFLDNSTIDFMATKVTEVPFQLLQHLGTTSSLLRGTEGFEGPSALISAEPKPSPRQLLTRLTHLFAASPLALQLLAVQYSKILASAVISSHAVTAGHIYENLVRVTFAMGGDFRVAPLLDTPDVKEAQKERRVDRATKEGVLTLGPANILTSETGKGATENFRAMWNKLPTQPPEPRSNTEPDAQSTVEVSKAFLLRGLTLLTLEQRRNALSRYEQDWAPSVEGEELSLAMAELDGLKLQRELLVPATMNNTVPCVDAVDAKLRAYSMKAGKFADATLAYSSMENHLDCVGAKEGEGERLQLYWCVPEEEFEAVIDEGKLHRRPLKGGDTANHEQLRKRYDEWILCSPPLDMTPFVDAAKIVWGESV